MEGISATLARIYEHRRVRRPSDIDYSLTHLLPPTALTGIGAAVDLLEQALAADAGILFIGDYDADGATACALGVLALRRLGGVDVDYLVPNRFEFGYGLSPEIVGVAAARQPDVIVTVDNGIASLEGVSVARELGLSVLITDHHLPPAELPEADVIVNPNLPGDGFPSKALAGVGVIFYVMMALRQRLREQDWFRQRGIPEPNLATFLDLVAVGTVADLVPLDRNNRIMVAQGIARINGGHCRPGLRAILEAADLAPQRVASRDLGFVIAPRLNASGRLEDMALGIECLLTDDMVRARMHAARLDALNRERRRIEAPMQQQAVEIVNGLHINGELPMGLCLYDESWHQGIVGLVAARVRERTGRPAIVFAEDDNGLLKGSGRSIDGLHMRDLLDAIATRHPNLLRKFGGHAMAAGLTLEKNALDTFRNEFDKAICKQLDGGEMIESLFSDGALDDDELNVEFAELLRRAGPWGQGFPEPLFDDQFEILEHRTVGEHHLKLRVCRVDGKKPIDAIAFNYFHRHASPPSGNTLRLVYRLDVNEYRNIQTPQLIVEHVAPC